MIKKITKNVLSDKFLAEEKLKFVRAVLNSNITPEYLKIWFDKVRGYLPRIIVRTCISLSKDITASLELNLQSYGDREIFFNAYEPAMVKFYPEILKSKKIVWDIGSNTGFYVVMAGILLKEKGKVYAFEPAPLNYKSLHNNVKLNKLDNVVLFNIALSSENGEATIYLLNTQNPTGTPTLNKEWGQKSRLEERITINTMNAMSLLADGRIERPDLIKMDAETHEPVILRSIVPLLTDDLAPDIITEIMPPTIDPLKAILIEECGYECYHIRPNGIRPVNELKMRRPYNDYFFTKDTVDVTK